MKRLANSLIPVAVLVLFGACVTGVLAFLVVLAASLGLGEWQLFVYFQRLNLPALSIVLPIIGMILFTAILIGISGRREREAEPVAGESSSDPATTVGARKEEDRLKAA